MPRKPSSPRIVAVAGGKGGVGKSTVAVNLALAMARIGHRVTLVDADLGSANLHTMLGVLNPTSGLADFLDHRVDTLDALKTCVIAPTFTLVPGTSRPGAANLERTEKRRLIDAICQIDADCVILDVGAGASFNVVDLVAVADHKLFVLTPQLPSLHNAYALLKACVHRVIRRLAMNEVERGLVDAALGQETRSRTMVQLLEVVRPLDPVLANRIVEGLLHFGVAIVANQVETPADAAALSRMSPLILDHLMTPAPVMATVRRSSALAGSLRAGEGTLAGVDENGAVFRKLARTLVQMDLAQLRGTVRPVGPYTQPLWVHREAES
ncbi:MAG: P-loop NTPase [Myxococcales bacterium]|nr:P-loop NTPase [Myxococcales bacterium]